MIQEIYNDLEQFYVNYAGGQVDDAPFDKQYPTLPLTDRLELQQRILNDFGVTNPTMHVSWITLNKLGPLFVYRTQPGTTSTLYSGMNVKVLGNTYTVGEEKNVKNQSIHYFTLGNNGSAVDFMDEQVYSTSNQDQVDKCNAAVAEMIRVTTDGDTLQSIPVRTQVIYAETPIVGDTFPKIVASEDDKHFSVTSLL